MRSVYELKLCQKWPHAFRPDLLAELLGYIAGKTTGYLIVICVYTIHLLFDTVNLKDIKKESFDRSSIDVANVL